MLSWNSLHGFSHYQHQKSKFYFTIIQKKIYRYILSDFLGASCPHTCVCETILAVLFRTVEYLALPKYIFLSFRCPHVVFSLIVLFMWWSSGSSHTLYTLFQNCRAQKDISKAGISFRIVCEKNYLRGSIDIGCSF